MKLLKSIFLKAETICLTLTVEYVAANYAETHIDHPDSSKKTRRLSECFDDKGGLESHAFHVWERWWKWIFLIDTDCSLSR